MSPLLINQAENTTPLKTELLGITDPSTGLVDRITLENFTKYFNELTDLPSVAGADIIAILDAGTTPRKATVTNLATAIESLLSSAGLTTKGLVELATIAETNTGIDATRAVTPDGLDGWTGSAQIVTVGTLSAGDVDAAVSPSSDTVAGKVELATAAETNTGTDATRAITPDGLEDWEGSAQIITVGTLTSGNLDTLLKASDYGKRTMAVSVNDLNALTSGDGKAYFPRIPSYWNGWNITKVTANIVAGTALVTIQIHNLTQTADVLSTELTIDANEKDSKDATTPAVIDTGEDDLQTGDRLRIDIDGEGTGTTWLDVQITVQEP